MGREEGSFFVSEFRIVLVVIASSLNPSDCLSQHALLLFGVSHEIGQQVRTTMTTNGDYTSRDHKESTRRNTGNGFVN